MHAHRLRPMFGRRNLGPLTAFFLLSLVVVCGLTASTTQSSAESSAGNGRGNQLPPESNNQHPEDEFNDDDLKVKGEKPRGKWSFATLLDMSQVKDPAVPVAVSGIQSLSGGGKHIGITKIKRVEIKNRSPQIVNAVQLRWTVASLEDPAKVLSEGTTQFANTWVEANGSRVVEIPTVYPALLLKPLAKAGELYGRFQVIISVQETRFVDGSFWRRQESSAYLNFIYPDQFLAGSFPSLASAAPRIPAQY